MRRLGRTTRPDLGVVVDSPGDELVNRKSTSTLARERVHWRTATDSSHRWCHLPPDGAPSLHGKEGVDGSSPSEGFEERAANVDLSRFSGSLRRSVLIPHPSQGHCGGSRPLVRV